MNLLKYGCCQVGTATYQAVAKSRRSLDLDIQLIEVCGSI